MTTPRTTGMTPRMAGMTPSSHSVGGSYGFSPALLGQSPAALLAKHRSPLPSGNFNSPGMLAALGMDLRGGINISATLQQMPQLPPDENKKRELAEILKLLASRPGRISETAVERLAKGMGLDCYRDRAPDGLTTLSMAAKIFLLDIEFIGDRIERVQLSFEKTVGPSSDLAPQAAAIFQKNLTPEPKIPGRTPLLTASLADFAENLNRLYRTDKLSTSLNCFDAITGIYQSLQRVYDWEKENMGGEINALCVGSGRPMMHTRGKVGLSVDYWRGRMIGAGASTNSDAGKEDGHCLWRVIIEVEETPPDYGNMNMNTITPVRASDHWVSEEIKKPREDILFGDMEEFIIDWLEPPLEELMDVPGDPTQFRPPSARFLARLDPPVIVPLQDEMEIHPGVMVTPDVDTLERLFFPHISKDDCIYRSIHIPQPPDMEEPARCISHRYKLHSYLKPIYGRRVSAIPFSHPKDLLPIFRTLRQYTLLTTLLESCFTSPGCSKTPKVFDDPSAEGTKDVPDNLESFLNDDRSYAPLPNNSVPIDITLEPEHNFGLRLVFPGGAASGVTNLQLQVGRNAELMVHNSGQKQNGAAMRPIEALKTSEDLGLVVEWIRQQGW